MLKRIQVEGFKSIQKMDLELGPINVLIGANGAGKSNFVSLFKMLNFLISNGLQTFIATAGYASSLLYYGPKKTPQMEATLSYQSNSGDSDTVNNDYHLRLAHAASDTLIFTDEWISYHKKGYPNPKRTSLESGHKETRIHNEADDNKNLNAKTIRHILQKCRVYQFHDTSKDSRIRNATPIREGDYLRDDAGNLAAYLYRLKRDYPQHYRRLISTINLVAPHFGDFDLAPDTENPNSIFLNWHEKTFDHSFRAHQISDGLLRFMALSTLLLQPKELLPDIIIIDEPELGLHPSAINVLVGLIRKAACYSQVIIATQSVRIVDQFSPKEILVVERKKGATEFHKPDSEYLKVWLEDYTLGEIWEKNLIGGRP